MRIRRLQPRPVIGCSSVVNKTTKHRGQTPSNSSKGDSRIFPTTHSVDRGPCHYCTPLLAQPTCPLRLSSSTRAGTASPGIALMAFPPDARVPIAQLRPALDASVGFVEGLVTLVWPYSPSHQSTRILLVEPDFRLRPNRGQVRISFIGASARAVAKSGLTSGDRVSVRLAAAVWLPEDTGGTTPGRGPGWELQYGQRVTLQVTPGSTTWHCPLTKPSDLPRS